MSAIEQQIIERLHQLGTDDQEKVLAFMESLHDKVPKRYSPRELMRLPAEERDRLVAEAFDRAATMDFETFEAYTEELDDEP
jgi:hypothetical protein